MTMPISQGNLLGEIGAIGLPGGNAQDGFIQQEFLPELRGPQGMRKYQEMASNDPVLGALLFAIDMPIKALEWRIEAVDDSDAAQTAREWVEDEFFHLMRTPWPDVVTNALSMNTYGFCLQELVFAKRPDGSVGIDKMAMRVQETLLRWRFDPAGTGDVVGVDQYTLNRHGMTTIPAYKFVNFRTNTARNNPEGRSLLRNCYKTYLRKESIEQAEGRAAIRSAGIVVMRVPGRIMRADADVIDKQIFATYKQIAATLAQDRQGSIVIPSDMDQNGHRLIEMEYIVADGRRPTDMTPIIERYDRRMAMTALADWLLLGQQAVGSFKLASSKTSMFAFACQAIVAAIEDPMNQVVLPRLWAVNGFDPLVMPRFSAGDLESTDLIALGTYLTQLASAGMPLFPDDRLEAVLRENAYLPAKSPDAAAAMAARAEAILAPKATAVTNPSGGPQPKPPQGPTP